MRAGYGGAVVWQNFSRPTLNQVNMLDIKDTPPPPVLYKFMTINGERWTWFQNLIRLGQIYLSSPTDFNDPFDCLPRLEIPSNQDKRLKKGLFRAGARQGDSRKVRRKKVKTVRSLPNSVWRKTYRDFAYRRIRAVGVYCVSANNSHPLMWSHYAEKHTGLLIGFKADIGIFRLAQKIEYSDIRPHYSHLSTNSKEFYDVYHKKAKFWEYEEEYRIISLNTEIDPKSLMRGMEDDADLMRFIGRPAGHGPATLSPSVIASITFGCNMPPNERTKVVDFVRAQGLNVEFFEAVLDEHKFALSIRPFATAREPARNRRRQ
ncbi:DUF2971 domain-containing protein [Cupriavidus oxalaticus]|uniref:DUF2971 domain-containing protein n=1 Tax=Cupriavidus oxalaticus TaxID=96344 RepID=A0A5P3VKC2_9BURK|nr:DUF2971 domain-containing protein [Cupriavidus oxalaticus]QEZ45701.1 DUF2971 domain-containing protein [Cupriavidus oxalaticus]